MKFGFLQGDFSTGELSPRAQGHADSDAYKAALKLASNCAPTRTGSIASRAGLKFLLEGIDAHTLAASNLPVQHIVVHDGPYGDFVIEVSPTGIRMMDKGGVLPWNFPPSSEFLQFTSQFGTFAYGDPDTRTVYLRSEAASGVRGYYLTKGTGVYNALLGSLIYLGTPLTTNDFWTLSGSIAGDSVTALVAQSNPANFQNLAIAPDSSGKFSITFKPNIGGADQDFLIQLKTGAGTTSTVLWNLKLTKNAVKEVQDTTAVIGPSVFGGFGTAPTQERIRGAAFWAVNDFWVALAGGANNAYAGFALRWTNPGGGTLLTTWTFGTLPCTPNSLAQISGANTVAVFQDRLWYGINLPNGKRVIRGSRVGFGHTWGINAQAGSTGAPRPYGAPDWLFQFITETESFTTGVGAHSFTYHFPSSTPKAELSVTVNGLTVLNTADWTQAGQTFYWESWPDTGPNLGDQNFSPGGIITFNPAGGTGVTTGDVVKISRVAQATDSLDLNLASPTGKIAWLNVLRGLMLGTTRNEKLFEQGAVLALDPASGQSFNLRDESSHGADPALTALDINDRVLFVQRGRKILRLAGISINTDGGLVSEDVGVSGEHLTKLRVRSMCYLKSPVPRAVFAFDNGTGAVMTLVGKGVAFSRLSIPACFGGIYSVANLDSDDDSELWVGTESGVTLWAKTFESDILVKEVQLPNAVPAAPTHLVYDNDNPLPPVMDGWVRRPLVNQSGTQYITGLPASSVGQNSYAFINGQVYGPYPVVADGLGGGGVTFPGALALDITWIDAAGKRRAQEIYVGIAFPEHRWTSLPIEGGNPVGTAQNLTSRKQQLYVRFVDSYMPLINGTRAGERAPTDVFDVIAGRITGDRRVTEMAFQRGAVVDVVMDLPLRMEISAIFGGVVVNNI